MKFLRYQFLRIDKNGQESASSGDGGVVVGAALHGQIFCLSPCHPSRQNSPSPPPLTRGSSGSKGQFMVMLSQINSSNSADGSYYQLRFSGTHCCWWITRDKLSRRRYSMSYSLEYIKSIPNEYVEYPKNGHGHSSGFMLSKFLR